ncbi:MAG: hypothetical protein PVJ57_16365 [Phycisphaerae bacterium]
MRVPVIVAIVLMLGMGVAAGDVYFEVTGHGEAPDGNTSDFPFFYDGYFDVYVWGGGADDALGLAEFDIVLGDGEVTFHELGIVDPGGLFGGETDAGTIQSDRINDVLVAEVPPAFEPLPQSAGEALLLYSNFHMYFDGYVDVSVEDILTNTGSSPTIHSIGVETTPEPGALLLLAVGVLTVRRR